MATQTNYPSGMSAAFAGMIATMEHTNLISREVETAAIGFGKVVTQGTADGAIIAATAADEVVIGITARDQSVTSSDQFAVGETALVLDKGPIWVVAGEAVAAGAAVYMIVAGGQAGNFGDTATDNLAIPNAIFDTSAAAAGDLVKIRVR